LPHESGCGTVSRARSLGCLWTHDQKYPKMRQNAFSRRPTINASRHLFHFDGVTDRHLFHFDGVTESVTKVFSRAAQLRPLRCCPLLGFEHEVSCTNLRICAKLPRATYAEPLECSVPLNGGCGARYMQPGLRTDRPLAVSSMLAQRNELEPQG
jgi:hypothetical protein